MPRHADLLRSQHSLVRGAAAVLVGLAVCSEARAANEGDLSFELPADAGKQGLSFPAQGQPTRYRYQPTLAPTLLGQRWSIGLPLAGVLDDDWRFGVGLRPALRLWAFHDLRDVALWGEAEGLLVVPQARAVLQAGLVVKAGPLRLGVWGGRTTGGDGRWSLSSGVGVDVVGLVKVVRGPTETDVREKVPSRGEATLLDQFEAGVFSRVAGTPSDRLPGIACWVFAHRRELERRASLDTLEALARDAGQTELLQAIAETRRALPQVPDGPAARAAADGAVRAAKEARKELDFHCP